MALGMWGIWLALSMCSGILYRLGGSEDYDTVWRDWVLPILPLLLIFLITKRLHFTYLIAYGLLGASLTTYNKWASRLAGYGDNEVHAISWYVTGFLYGLAFLPLMAFIDWKFILLRSVILSLLITLWSERQDNAVWEEMGRGLCITCTIPILFMP